MVLDAFAAVAVAAALGPLHPEAARRRHDAVPACVRLAGGGQAAGAGPEE